MRKLFHVSVFCVLAALFPCIANASANFGTESRWAASLGLGTTGVTAGLFYRETPHFVANLDAGGFAVDPSFSAGGENYHMGIRLLSARLTEDWYPFWHNNLFLAAGVLFNGDKFSLQPTATHGDYAFATPASFRFSPVAPYLGVGWGDPFAGSRWTFRVEAGAAYEGSPNVFVTMGADPYAIQAYQAEKSSISAALGGYHWYPVVQASLVYRFG